MIYFVASPRCSIYIVSGGLVELIYTSVFFVDYFFKFISLGFLIVGLGSLIWLLRFPNRYFFKFRVWFSLFYILGLQVAISSSFP